MGGLRQGVVIRPGSMRDFSYLAANMNEADWQEIACQIPKGTSTTEIAALCLGGRATWAAIWRGQPVAGFGIHSMTAAGNVCSLWLFGTRESWRAIPSIEEFVATECGPRWLDEGVTRIECRSDLRHSAAHRWLRRLGFAEEPCAEWGRDGEPFILFWLTRERWLTKELVRSSAT